MSLKIAGSAGERITDEIGHECATEAALEERDRAVNDSKRLDWLEANSFKAQKICWDKHCGKFTQWDLRTAIDAAMRTDSREFGLEGR